MARCITLQGFGVDEIDGVCLVELEGWGAEPAEWFERILREAFPESEFYRATEPQESGLLGFEMTLSLAGRLPEGGAEEVERFLALVTRVLTIEDSLDESHALGYHQDDNETGALVRSELGTLIIRAKYKHIAEAREAIRAALVRFIQGHPRYRRADALAAVPPHQAGGRNSLCQRLVAPIANESGFQTVGIVKATTTAEQKEIIDEDRERGVGRRFDNQRGTMRVDDDVTGLTVVVLDDLYGSGGSMAEAARALREAGAAEVLGLAVTKQRLYEGVRLVTLD